MSQLSFLANDQRQTLTDLASELDAQAFNPGSVPGVILGTTPLMRPPTRAPPGKPKPSPLIAASNMKSENPEHHMFRDTLNLRIQRHLQESKDCLENLLSTWNRGADHKPKQLLTALKQVESAIRNVVNHDLVKVNEQISIPSSPTSSLAPSTSSNSLRNTSEPMQDTIDSLVCTENYDDVIPSTPPTRKRPLYGTGAIQAPERPRKPLGYSLFSTEDSPYISDPALQVPWPGFLDSQPNIGE